MAILFGLVVFGLSSCEETDPGGFMRSATHGIKKGWELIGPLLGVASALILFPVAAALVVRVLTVFGSWALREQIDLDRGTKLMVGALWPFTFLAGVVMFTFLGITNRMFRE